MQSILIYSQLSAVGNVEKPYGEVGIVWEIGTFSHFGCYSTNKVNEMY